MATYHTVDGQPYAVTAGTDVTVTDADGLVLSVAAGGQGSFVGNGGDVEVTGNHHFMQVKGGFAVGDGGGGGGGEPFDGHLNADLVIGKGVTGTKAEWTVHLGSLTSQGCLEESTTGYGCCVGVKPSRDAHELVEDINTESSLGLIVEAVYVSETELKLVARRPGEYANGYSISANDAGEPGVESPCFGRGAVPRTVDGRIEVPATAYSATLNGERMLTAADVDTVPRLYSMNPVSSDGVRRKLAEKASVADDNYFTGDNSFNSSTYFNGSDTYFNGSNTYFSVPPHLPGGLYLSCSASTSSKLSMGSDGNLYWGYTKLNGGGDVRSSENNVFTGYNTFNTDTSFNNGVSLNDLGYLRGYGLYQYNCDLYWGCTKLNGGDVGTGYARLGSDNVFTGYNTFNDSITFNSCVAVRKPINFYDDININCGNALYLSPRRSSYCSDHLYNYYGSLYWGGNKVWTVRDMGSAGAYARRDCGNTFTASTTFSDNTYFNNNAFFNGGANFSGDAHFHDYTYLHDKGGQVGCHALYNYNGDLYWGSTKLNGGGGGGGGDVYTNRNNEFIGGNAFNGTTCLYGDVFLHDRRHQVNNGLYNYNGNLYWGATKLNGGGGGGDVYTDRNNVFIRDNTFDGSVDFYGSACFYGDVLLVDRGFPANNGLYNYNGDLYWKTTKLNGGGGDEYARLDGCNVFTGENTFDGTVNLNRGKVFTGGVKLYDGGSSVPYDTYLMNHNGDLYWGTTKLGSGGGGGGDVYTDSNNVFTGRCNVFKNAVQFSGNVSFDDRGRQTNIGLYNYNGDLYWEDTKLGNGDVTQAGSNVFTGSNTFNGSTYFRHGVDFGSGAQFLNIGHKVQGSNLYNYAGDLYWGNQKLNVDLGSYAKLVGDNVFTSVNTFNGYTHFFGRTDLVGPMSLSDNGTARFGPDAHATGTLLKSCNGYLHWGNTRLNSALHNPATTGGTVEITIGDKSLVLDCAKLQTLINLLEA